MKLKYISKINDVIGNEYLAIKYNSEELSFFVNKWISLFDLKDKSILENVCEMIGNRHRRDGEEYHMTIINVMQYATLNNHVMFSKIDDIEYLGIGTASKNNNITYFIIASSKKIDNFREENGLEKIDLHITVGFKTKDVFGVDKSENSLILKF
jgi:hypothetical protein